MNQKGSSSSHNCSCSFNIATNALVQVQQVHTSHSETMFIIDIFCHHCNAKFTWKSQPYLNGRFPAGSMCWASVTKVLRVFKHIGLLGYSEATYYYHQRHFLFPSIMSYWQHYQKSILDSLKGKEVVVAGDGRHDSMRHSAKYCTYTMFCCTVGLIVHLVVIQVKLKM